MIIAARPRRSALYLPASNARAIEKARSLQADSIILDLEDSVAPAAKPEARAAACAAVRSGGFGRRETVIRINGLETPYGIEDLVDAAAAGPDAILLPKVEDPETVTRAGALIAEAGGRAETSLWAMMETPRAMLAAREIAAAGGRLAGFVMGTNDLLKDLRAASRRDRLPLVTGLGLSLLAARAHGLFILDGVYNALSDLGGFEDECRQGRDLGFDGKTLIHPNQISPCNAIFSPAPEAIAWARAVISAFAAPEAAKKGAVQLEGRMIERLHLVDAERLVSVAEAIRAAESAEP